MSHGTRRVAARMPRAGGLFILFAAAVGCNSAPKYREPTKPILPQSANPVAGLPVAKAAAPPGTTFGARPAARSPVVTNTGFASKPVGGDAPNPNSAATTPIGVPGLRTSGGFPPAMSTQPAADPVPPPAMSDVRMPAISPPAMPSAPAAFTPPVMPAMADSPAMQIIPPGPPAPPSAPLPPPGLGGM